MIVLAVVWKAKPVHEAEVAELLRKLTEASRKEPGCLMYQVHRHKDDSALFFIYEQYKDEAALEAHRQTPHFLEYARKQLTPIAERLEGSLYLPLD